MTICNTVVGHAQAAIYFPRGKILQIIKQILELRDRGKTLREIAKELRLSEPRVSNLKRIGERARPRWLGWVEEGRLSLKHIEAVLNVEGDDADDLLRKAVAKRWSAAKLRGAVQELRGIAPNDAPNPHPDIAELERRLTEHLAARTRLTVEGQGGELRIQFTDNDTLEGLLERLGFRFE